MNRPGGPRPSSRGGLPRVSSSASSASSASAGQLPALSRRASLREPAEGSSKGVAPASAPQTLARDVRPPVCVCVCVCVCVFVCVCVRCLLERTYQELASLGRDALEAAFCNLQDDHARRKEAFDQVPCTVCVAWHARDGSTHAGLPVPTAHSYVTATIRASRADRHSKRTTRDSARSSADTSSWHPTPAPRTKARAATWRRCRRR